MNSSVFFDGWEGVARVLIVSPLAYLALVLVLRISGKRTLTKLNAFDLVVTVALGSVLATQILSKDTPLLEGVTSFLVLIVLQWVVTATSVRSSFIRKLVRAEPSVLVNDGLMQHEVMRRERITENEVLQAIHASGEKDVNSVSAVFLQTDGSLAVIRGEVADA